MSDIYGCLLRFSGPFCVPLAVVFLSIFMPKSHHFACFLRALHAVDLFRLMHNTKTDLFVFRATLRLNSSAHTHTHTRNIAMYRIKHCASIHPMYWHSQITSNRMCIASCLQLECCTRVDDDDDDRIVGQTNEWMNERTNGAAHRPNNVVMLNQRG